MKPPALQSTKSRQDSSTRSSGHSGIIAELARAERPSIHTTRSTEMVYAVFVLAVGVLFLATAV